MSGLVGTLEGFDHLNQDWTVYKNRLFNWFTANQITDETDKSAVRRKAILLSALTEGSYKLVRDLVFPTEVEQIEFTVLTKSLDTHFQPKRCGFADRSQFYEALQQSGEGIPEWAVRVGGLAVHCGFSLTLEETLRDKFVLGMQPGPEREKLFEQDVATLTLSRAVEIAQGVRCARMAAKPEVQEVLKVSAKTGGRLI